MAYRVTAKQVGNNGSTPGNRVVFHVHGSNHSLDSDDFTFTKDIGTVVIKASRIESVINMGTSDCTIDGKVFETGRWELSQIGGIPLEVDSQAAVSFTTAASGNVLIEFRS